MGKNNTKQAEAKTAASKASKSSEQAVPASDNREDVVTFKQYVLIIAIFGGVFLLSLAPFKILPQYRNDPYLIWLLGFATLLFVVLVAAVDMALDRWLKD